MSGIGRVSAYSTLLTTIRDLGERQRSVGKLTEQLATHRRSSDLADYGTEARSLLDLRAELVGRAAHLQSLDTVAPRLKATDAVLSKLEKLVAGWSRSALGAAVPGPPRITSVENRNPDALSVSLNLGASSLKQGAGFTITAAPSRTGANGTFDVTVSDGLGGTSVRSINLKTVPPNDGKGYNFRIGGGPGEGAVVNLTFDRLEAASSSHVAVAFPNADALRDRTDNALRDIRQYLNERVGDRHLFAGTRYATEPVTDLTAGKPVSLVTFHGPLVRSGDYYEVTVNGRRFGHQVGPRDPQTRSSVAEALAQQIGAADPPLPVTVQAKDGVLSLTGSSTATPLAVTARLVGGLGVDNAIDPPATLQTASATRPRIDAVTLKGGQVDVGDTFKIAVGVGDPKDPDNRHYYARHPTAPRTLPPYRTYEVSYTVTEADHRAGVTDVGKVADQLRERFGALRPRPPVTMDATGNGATIRLTGSVDPAHRDRPVSFSTTGKVINSPSGGAVTVATPPLSSDLGTGIVSAPALPFYDAERSLRRDSAAAHAKATVPTANGTELAYGVTATDPAFQTLINAFRLVRVAAANPGEAGELMKRSRTMMTAARDGLAALHAGVASNLATLEDSRTTQRAAIAAVTGRIARIEGVDDAEVAVRLRAAMTGLQTGYTVAGKIGKLSLLNFLT